MPATTQELASALWDKPDGIEPRLNRLEPKVDAHHEILTKQDRLRFWLLTFLAGAMVTIFAAILTISISLYVAFYSPSAQWAQKQLDEHSGAWVHEIKAGVSQ